IRTLGGADAAAGVVGLAPHQGLEVGLQTPALGAADPAGAHGGLDAGVESVAFVGQRPPLAIAVILALLLDPLRQPLIAIAQIGPLLHGQPAIGGVARLQLDQPVIVGPQTVGLGVGDRAVAHAGVDTGFQIG